MRELNKTQRIGLGCMNLSHAYGTPPPEAQSLKLLEDALDLGYDHFDTATLYGFGTNEQLVGKVVSRRRDDLYLASKCGLMKGADGKRAIDGRPDVLKKNCEDSLKRLQVEMIDLYYLHRWDKTVPIEDSVGALSDLVSEGKIRHIGLSEVSSATLRKANAVHPITAVQTEYSLWTRNPEISIFDTCKELGTTFVAFSPLGRGFLSSELARVDNLVAGDLRKSMPRFNAENYAQNRKLLVPVAEMAKDKCVTIAQLALAWVLHHDKKIIAIPGTTSIQHMKDNFAAMEIALSDSEMLLLDQAINQNNVVGGRYPAQVQSEIDTEEFSREV